MYENCKITFLTFAHISQMDVTLKSKNRLDGSAVMKVCSFYTRNIQLLLMGRDGDRYGLDGPGIEFRWGRNFSHLSRLPLGPTQLPTQWAPRLSRG
jgi:hypothetical protein